MPRNLLNHSSPQYSEARHLTQSAARERHWLRLQQHRAKRLVVQQVLSSVEVTNTGAGDVTTAGAAGLGEGRYGVGKIAYGGMGRVWVMEHVDYGCIDGLMDGGLATVCECADVVGGTCVGLDAARTVPWRPEKLLEGDFESTMQQTGAIYLVALTMAWLIDKLTCRLSDPERVINRARSAPLKRPD